MSAGSANVFAAKPKEGITVISALTHEVNALKITSLHTNLPSALWKNNQSDAVTYSVTSKSLFTMEDVMREFRRAFDDRNGHAVAATITPIAPQHDAGRLYAFWRSSSSISVQEDLLYQLLTDDQFSKDEAEAWTKVFIAYWKAVGELLAAEEALNRGQSQNAPWAKVFEAWKDLVTQLYHGYASNHFPAWTIPCLYVGGKYLRIFAIKADEQVKLTEGSVTLNEGFEDDIVGSMDKSENLEEAARQLNRIFGTCINDKFVDIEPIENHMDLQSTARSPLIDSRKWALYHIANLLFQVYFKVRCPPISS